MADQTNRGGQKKGKQGRQDTQSSEEKRGTTTHGQGERSDQDKRADQMSNPDARNKIPDNERR